MPAKLQLQRSTVPPPAVRVILRSLDTMLPLHDTVFSVCSRTKRSLIDIGVTGRLDGLTISSAGLDTEAAVIVYRGEVTGATLLTANRGIYVSDTVRPFFDLCEELIQANGFVV